MSQVRVRRRATKACLGCRERKVRCDVVICGPPCTNCYLDGKSCIITQRMNKRRRPQSPDVLWDVSGSSFSPLRAKKTSNSPEHLERGVAGAFAYGNAFGQGGDADTSAGIPLANAPSSPDSTDSPLLCPVQAAKTHIASARSNEVHYSDYSFMTMRNWGLLSQQDVHFLDLKGCLRLPPKVILDEFMRLYFLHVHPRLPLLDEGSFWTTYCLDPAPDPPNQGISLLLMQAMIFATSATIQWLLRTEEFAMQATIQSLGFTDIRRARSTFYQRAKVLFDFNAESSPMVLSQAALLLSFWYSMSRTGPQKPNSLWLSIAIHHARCLGAHEAWETPDLPAQSEESHLLRRLWWCCVIRDRILSLGLRRRLQITKVPPVLLPSEFENEINHSEVIRPENKRKLVCILLREMELCGLLTDLLELICLPDCYRVNYTQKEIAKLSGCRDALQKWFIVTSTVIPTPQLDNRFRDQSVIVHGNLMYMYYHFECGREVQEASFSVMECLEELTQLGLVQYLPLSVMAFIAFPLLLSTLDLQVLATANLPAKLAKKKHRFQVLVDAMKEIEPRHDGVELIHTAIRHLVNLVQVDNALTSNSLITEFTDVLAWKPGIYLRLTLTMDLSLSLIRLPEDRDFPIALRSNCGPEANLMLSSIYLESHQSTVSSDEVQVLQGEAYQTPDEASGPSMCITREKTNTSHHRANDAAIAGNMSQSGDDLASPRFTDKLFPEASLPTPWDDHEATSPSVTGNDHLSSLIDSTCTATHQHCTDGTASQFDTLESLWEWEDMYIKNSPGLVDIL
ncbi:related to cutinase transcription factor 1 beta [Fusarium fujikuroi IMI 58289]|uniref:Related to cutinase transcription factor 1 beta n=1 Tax=Gibberella fujikuroi (strain CBS 195.34 / IMI 58289 / NRRL A-6831) TaxID=1279085 RepID=S0ED91_GIBF5|nr:related to cutinase transcription factor 1 beta [Fusarium fujikuroi IMI 58289]CCT72854.1 related to cutinase transcription factor 1 beta [Fusarium fujikuroi IMI 58289]SCO25079.1 related to cutinase transcription factor 1 beta [Fusarium fujikuroi]SCO54107.1 related to cutinase transcription factor 1 beta [Fusarium fujikuroi]